MIHILVSSSGLTKFLFGDIERDNKRIKPIFVHIVKHSNIFVKFIKMLYYIVSDSFFINTFPKETTKRLKQIKPDDKFIYIGDNIYTVKLLSTILNHVKEKYIYLWNPCCNGLNRQRVSRRIQNSDKPLVDSIINYFIQHKFKPYTFDTEDSKSYNIQYNPQFYKLVTLSTSNITKAQNVFFFCGREKNRGHIIEQYKNFLCNKGVLNFYVIKDRDDKTIEYSDYLESIDKCNVICDILQEGQTGLTIRAMEGLFFQKKVITNNKSVTKYKFYNKNNFLITSDKTNSVDIDIFLSKPYIPASDEIKEYYSIDGWASRFK